MYKQIIFFNKMFEFLLKKPVQRSDQQYKNGTYLSVIEIKLIIYSNETYSILLSYVAQGNGI